MLTPSYIWRRLAACSFFVATFLFLLPTTTAAQGVDIIRGRVTGPDGQPLPNVTVTATTLTGQVSRSARTNTDGRYTISFPGGEGDYWVNFSAIGLTPRRYQVKRTADQEILIADARLAPAAINLEAVTVTSRSAASRADTVGDVSGNERDLNNADPGQLAAEQMGDLVAMASAIPGVQLLPGQDGGADQFSVFGLSGDQNNTQLNGLNFGEGNIPRDAQVFASLATAPYDVSRGGFSGGQLTIRTRAGSNFVRRSLSSNVVAPQTQWLDRAAISSGQQYTNLSMGGSAAGPIRPDRMFFNTSFQLDRRLNDLQTLVNTDALGFTTAGVNADSVQRFLGILGSQQLPANLAGFPGQRINDRASLLGSVDFTPTNSARGNTFAITASGNVNRSQPVSTSGFGGGGFGGGGFGGFGGFGGGNSALATPTRQGKTLNASGSLQLRHSGLLGIGGILTETTFGSSANLSDNDPYIFLPAATVRVNSQFADGTSSVRNLSFGGSPASNQSSGGATHGFVNTLSWFSPNNRHRVKFTSELRHESYWQDLTSNELGTFTFNSLGDLEAGIPASYTRQLAPRRRSGSQLVGAVSLGDAWRPVNDVQVQYGVRVDGNSFLNGPQQNADVERAFGFNNADVPSRLYVSPRIGFSWTYGTADQVAMIPGMVRAPRAVVRGGIGVFQNTPQTQSVGSAIDNTGLPGGLQQLTCLGNTAPIPVWSEYLADRGLIPSNCLDGSSGSVFANSNPNVFLFAPNFVAQRSLRSNLQWSGAVLKNRLGATVDVTYSRNFGQPGGIDLNFPERTQFTLADEGGRPVFVSPSSIVPTTGQAAWREARRVDAYGRVTQQRSELTSESRQLTLSVRPLAFNTQFSWNVSYVLTDVREQFYGFQSTTGLPSQRDWSPGNVSRHQIQYSIGYNFFDAVRVNWFGNVRSGFRYTPLIGGDVNGDSYNNDRAFIFSPTVATDPLVSSGMQSLLASGTTEARRCLESQLGALAGRNSCVAPWTTSANLSVSFNSLKIRLPQRATLSFQVQNPLGGLDRILNGQDNLKGWGQIIFPDQQLLYVRGFDPGTQRYRYEVNERFGSTRLSQSTIRQPVSVTALLRIDVGPTRERQQILQTLDRGRTREGTKPNLQQLRGIVAAGIVNPMQQILVQADSLKLTRRQADSLATLNRRYVLGADSLWTPLARELAELPDRYNHDQVYTKYRKARERGVDQLIALAPHVRGLLTPEQYRLLPPQIASFLDVRTLKSVRSGTSGDGFSGAMAGIGGFGGGMMGGGFGGRR